MMSFPGFVSPINGESVLMCLHPSLKSHIGMVLLGIVLTPVVIGLIILIVLVINAKTTSYVVTDKRVIVKTGLISVNMSEVRIQDIRGVNLRQGVLQRILGIGHVLIGTAATEGTEIVMSSVLDPRRLIGCINNQRNG